MTQLLVNHDLLLIATLRSFRNIVKCIVPCELPKLILHRPGMCTTGEHLWGRGGSAFSNPTLTLQWSEELTLLWGILGSMFNLSPQILSECACIQANHWLTYKKGKLLFPQDTQSYIQCFSVCACVLGGRGGLCTYLLCVCALEKGPGLWRVFFGRVLWRHPPTFALFLHQLEKRLMRVCACLRQVQEALKSFSEHLCCHFQWALVLFPLDFERTVTEMMLNACRTTRHRCMQRLLERVCVENTAWFCVHMMADTCTCSWSHENPLKSCKDRF